MPLSGSGTQQILSAGRDLENRLREPLCFRALLPHTYLMSGSAVCLSDLPNSTTRYIEMKKKNVETVEDIFGMHKSFLKFTQMYGI